MKIIKILICFLLLSGMNQQTIALTLNLKNSDIGSHNKSSGAIFTDLTSMTIADDATNLTITVTGTAISSTYGVYIDTDNNAATGYSNGADISGADFYIENGTIYSYSGTPPGWGWTPTTGLTVTNPTSSPRELEISRSTLGLSSSGTTINVIFLNTGSSTESLPASGNGMQSYTTTVAETVASDLTSMTLSDDGTNLEILIEGTGIASDYDVFIDIDNNSATGYSDGGSVAGADFYIDEFNLYSYSGTAPGWGWTVATGLTNTVTAGVSHKFTITRATLGLTSSGTVINVRFQNNGTTTEVLPASGMQAYTTTTASNLASLTLTDNVNLIMTVLGASISATYDAFIDSDNNAATGYAIGGIGADFLIQNGAFYSNNGGGFNWTPIATGLTVIDATGSRKFVVDRTSLGLTASGTDIKAMYQNTASFTPTDVLAAVSYTTTSAVISTSWTGATSKVWNLAGNWNNGIPNSSSIVTIPEVTTAPEIAATTGASVGNLTITEADGLVIDNGGSLIVSGSSTGNITYNRTLAYDSDSTKSWYLLASPVSGETVADFISNNTLESGTTNTSFRGIANYKIDGAGWNYYLNTYSDGDAFDAGKGYSVKRASAGDVSFTGTYTSGDKEYSINQTTNNFNLTGNPFVAYINLGTFFSDNATTNRLSEATIWLWDQSANSGAGAYEQKMSGTDGSFEIAPGQGFFVSSGSAASNKVVFTETNQSHQTDTFLKALRTEIHLNVSQEDVQHQTKLYYIEGTTTAFDNGYDGSMFSGISYDLAIYTQLVSNNEGKNLGIQSLPASDYENMVVPVGLKAGIGQEITFSAESFNLPSDIKVYLEDRLTNTFTRLDEVGSNYTITLDEALNGIGRFYLHTSTSQKVLNTNNTVLENLSIYKSGASTLRIVGLPQGNVNAKIFNILGKQVMHIAFDTNGVQDISLPKLASGIYVVQLETATSKLSKKIILE